MSSKGDDDDGDNSKIVVSVMMIMVDKLFSLLTQGNECANQNSHWFLTINIETRYGPGRQSRQQSLVKLGQLQQVPKSIENYVGGGDNEDADRALWEIRMIIS